MLCGLMAQTPGRIPGQTAEGLSVRQSLSPSGVAGKAGIRSAHLAPYDAPPRRYRSGRGPSPIPATPAVPRKERITDASHSLTLGQQYSFARREAETTRPCRVCLEGGGPAQHGSRTRRAWAGGWRPGPWSRLRPATARPRARWPRCGRWPCPCAVRRYATGVVGTPCAAHRRRLEDDAGGTTTLCARVMRAQQAAHTHLAWARHLPVPCPTWSS